MLHDLVICPRNSGISRTIYPRVTKAVIRITVLFLFCSLISLTAIAVDLALKEVKVDRPFNFNPKTGSISLEMKEVSIGDWFLRKENNEIVQFILVGMIKEPCFSMTQWQKLNLTNRGYIMLPEIVYGRASHHRRPIHLFYIQHPTYDDIKQGIINIRGKLIRILITKIQHQGVTTEVFYSGDAPSMNGVIQVRISDASNELAGFCLVDFGAIRDSIPIYDSPIHLSRNTVPSPTDIQILGKKNSPNVP